MKHRLNLRLLRPEASPRVGLGAVASGKLPAIEKTRLELSRRALFGWAGAATVGLSPALRALDTVALGAFQVIETRGLVAFRLGGRVRWELDIRRFGGRPRLRVNRQPDFICVTLSGATLPGTSLPADLVCELRPAVIGWRMRLQLALGGFEVVVPFERWLAGSIPASYR